MYFYSSFLLQYHIGFYIALQNENAAQCELNDINQTIPTCREMRELLRTRGRRQLKEWFQTSNQSEVRRAVKYLLGISNLPML